MRMDFHPTSRILPGEYSPGAAPGHSGSRVRNLIHGK